MTPISASVMLLRVAVYVIEVNKSRFLGMFQRVLASVRLA